MDPTNVSNSLEQTYRLLALCARAEGHPVFYEQLASQLRSFTAWAELPEQAELHGMAPLLYHHIRKSGIAIPPDTQRTLSGLYLRHRLHNQVHAQVLMEILAILREAGIQPLLLKGLALAYEYYPDPALRPIGDLDLLFKQADFLPALDLLEKAGFKIFNPFPGAKQMPGSMTAIAPKRDGISVQVELHHFDPHGHHAKSNSPDPEFQGLDTPPHAVSINGVTVYTTALMETFHYLLRHITKHIFIANPEKPIQLKWIADIVSLVERHAREIDWDAMKQEHPDILNRLEVFYSLTPLPESLAGIIPIRQVAPPSGLNQYPPGWPHQSIQKWKKVGLLRFIWQIFIPPTDWWVRLYYGLGEQHSLGWYRHVVYRGQVISAIFWVSMHRMDL